MVEDPLWKRTRLFFGTLKFKEGSISITARKIGYFVMFYIAIMIGSVVGLALIGVTAIAIPFLMIPLAAFLAHRLAQAAHVASNDIRSPKP